MIVDQAEALAAVMAEEYGFAVEIRREYVPALMGGETTAALVVPADAVRFIGRAGILAELTASEVDAFRLDYLGLDRAVF